MVDAPLADSFIKRNGIGVLRLPFGREESEQYLKRLEKRRELTVKDKVVEGRENKGAPTFLA